MYVLRWEEVPEILQCASIIGSQDESLDSVDSSQEGYICSCKKQEFLKGVLMIKNLNISSKIQEILHSFWMS